ncbi:MAG TPA: plasmid stabilization protein ParE [Parvularcula sp.]|nr:plasmid stabilization protein ParE [Parvularcula sp.]HBS30314.1 plasmid stabilization protein ParE [Parvularcula sp.]HBS36545.1 plasmid stabilization protein ParE [Parvularcula sp.]
MTRVTRRPAARADLIEIWLQTAERWGEAKADAYFAAIKIAERTLADHPYAGLDCSQIRKELRRYPIGSHFLYYREAGTEILIIRVLQKRMNADQHLDDDED